MSQIEVKSANLKSITVGKLQAKYSVDGTRILRYFVDFWHNDLDLHKELSAPEIYLLQGKVDALMASWDKKLAEHKRRTAIASGKDAADQMTVEASARLEALSEILAHTLKVDDRVNWDALKDRSAFTADPRFSESSPRRRKSPSPNYSEPHLTFWDTLFGRKAGKLAKAKESHEHEKRNWEQEDKRHRALFEKQTNEWNARKAAFEKEYAARKQAFLDEQAERNAKIDVLANGVSTGDQQSVIEHATLVLEKSDYGDLFEKSFEVDYVPEEKTLLIDYELPSPDHMPTLKTARFVPSTGEIRESYISEREKKANFDATCYQICLRTLLGMNLDTSTPTGKLMVNLLGFIAEFERELMLERQREGIVKAKADGKYKGRVPTAQRKAGEIVRLRDEGRTVPQIVAATGIQRSSVFRILKDAGKTRTPAA